MTKYFDVCAKKEYAYGGEMKVKVMRAGLLKVTEEGKMYLTLFHLPNIEYYLFEQQPKEELPSVQLEE